VLFRGRSSARLPIADQVQVWAGMVPLAGYLVVHLVTQASALGGPRSYAAWSDAGLRSAGLGLEFALIYVPLLLHVALGLRRFARRGAPKNESGEGASREGRAAQDGVSLLEALLQPVSGAVLLVFLLVHLYEFRFRLWTGQLGPSDYYPELCASLSSTRWGGVPAVALGYLLGVAAAALHGARGLYRGAIELGLVNADGERRWANCCRLLGLGLFALGALIVIDLATGSVLIELGGS
jgi:succinate dehydrogenase / fumarate reductase, cytochrome b subunit